MEKFLRLQAVCHHYNGPLESLRQQRHQERPRRFGHGIETQKVPSIDSPLQVSYRRRTASDLPPLRLLRQNPTLDAGT
jgi:hypothetical protein